MSTTVNYKGNTIATLNNETKTLTTGGTWVEADIQITDTSSGGSGTGAISVVDTIDSHGGTVRTITGLDISDTTAVASDVAQGKYFYTADGTKTAGVANSGGSLPALQAKTNISPTTSSQTITADSGYDGLSSVQINAMPVMTLPSSSSASSLGTSKATITPSSSIQYLNIPIGYNGAAQYYTISAVSGGPTPSATQHTIYFEFSDSTDTTITAYYDSTFISDAITATTPNTFGGKTVTLAQLDGVTWYNPADIPLNTQLVDYTAVKVNYIIDGTDGGEVFNEAGFASDYIVIDPTMTFTYVGYEWWDAAFYDASKVFISGFTQNSYADSIEDIYAHGTLTPSRIPSNAMYIRLTSYPAGEYSSSTMSLIRTS